MAAPGGHLAGVATTRWRTVRVTPEKCQAPEGLQVDRRGFNSVLAALVRGSLWLVPLASGSPLLFSAWEGPDSEAASSDPSGSTPREELPQSLPPVCRDDNDKGLLSFLSFQLLAPLPFLFRVPDTPCPAPKGQMGVSQVPGDKNKDTLLPHLAKRSCPSRAYLPAEPRPQALCPELI